MKWEPLSAFCIITIVAEVVIKFQIALENLLIWNALAEAWFLILHVGAKVDLLHSVWAGWDHFEGKRVFPVENFLELLLLWIIYHDLSDVFAIIKESLLQHFQSIIRFIIAPGGTLICRCSLATFANHR